MEPTFEVVVAPSTERYDPDDERWRAQVADFVAGLRDEADGVERRGTPVAGTKGSVTDIVLTLASAGTFTAAFEFFKGWLKKDTSRGLEITFTDGSGLTQTVALRGDAINETAMQALARAAVERMGGQGWPTPATEPS